MKTRSIFAIAILVATASTLFTATTHAQYVRYYHSYPYYVPYGYVRSVPYYYGAYGPFRAGGRPETSSGISFRFDGIPGALLAVIENSNVCISGKKLSGCKGAAIAYSSGRGGGHIALPPGTYDVEIRLQSPYTPITIQNVLVGKGEIIPLALPINNLIGKMPRVFSPEPPRPGSRITQIPNTQPIPQ